MAHICVLAFGRFNPPTTGHEKLFQKMQQLHSNAVDAVVFLSHTTDNDNPLPYPFKRELISVASPKLMIGPSSIRSPYQALDWAKERGYRSIVWIAGRDREENYQNMIQSWQQKSDPQKTIKLRFLVMNRESEVSATEARDAAREGKIHRLKALLISSAREPKTIQQILQLVRSKGKNMAITTFQEWLLREIDGEGSMSNAAMTMPAGGPTVGQSGTTNQNISAESDGSVPPPPKAKLPASAPENDGRMPADSKQQQAKLVLHPELRMKRMMTQRLDQLRMTPNDPTK